jgi:outer membrane receptor protein involved in Fe transport
MLFRLNKSLLLLPVIVSLSGFNLVAQEIEEVVVTSTKKAASIQDLALSVQALTSDDLVEAQITETEDMVELIPGIIQSPGVGSGTNMGIRGMISTTVGANSTAAVQAHINGMQVNQSVFTTIGFYDVSQIDILAGPQGTLFGRNATGGVINAITTPAEHNFDGSMRFDFGQDGQQRVGYAQNFDLSERLAMRIAAQAYEKDGQIYNIETGNMVDNRDTSDYRITLNYEINDTTELTFMHQSHAADDKRSHFNANFCARDPFYGCLPWEKGVLNAPAMATGTIDGLFGVIAQTNNFNDEYVNTIAAPTIDQINRDFDPHTKQDFEFSQLTLVKQFDNYELKINASRGDRDYTRTGDVDGSTASEGLTSGIMQLISQLGSVAAYGSEEAYGAAIAAGTADPYTNASPGGQFSMLLDLPCLDAPHNFTGDGSYECSQAPSVVDQIDINLVSDLDGPFNFVLGAFAWESDGHNKFYTHTAAYNVMRSFDLHPMSAFFDGTNPSLPVLAGQGYGGTAFYQTLMAEYFDGFAGEYDVENPFAAGGGGLTCAQLLAAGQNPLGTCDALLLDGGTYQQYLATVEVLAPNTFVRTLPLEIGGLVQDNPVIQQTLSLYGNFFYDISDDTKLTLGYRYNEDSYEDTSFNTLGDALNPAYVYSPTYDLASVGATFTEGEDSNSTYKLAIQHNLNDNVMVYASASTGNKPGGATPDQYGTPTIFAPETVDAFELGLRSILMDGALLMNLTAFSYDFKDAHYSQVVGSAAITNSIDYTHTGLEGQMKLFISPDTSVDFNFLALDSAIGAGESLFDPLNPNGASEITDYYNLMRPADIARLAAALDAAVAAGTISVGDITVDNPFFDAAAIVNGACAFDPATDPRAIACAPTLGGNGADYLAVLTGNPAAGSLLPFALFANTDKGFIATFQGFNLTETRFVNQVGLALPWLASEYEVDLEGKRTPFTSELDWNMALNHSMALMDGTLDLKLTYTHKGDSNGDLFESMNTYVPEAEYIDLYGNWTPASGDYNVGFYIKNLDDDRQLGAARTTSELVGGPVNVYYTQPRTAGVTFTYNF